MLLCLVNSLGRLWYCPLVQSCGEGGKVFGRWTYCQGVLTGRGAIDCPPRSTIIGYLCTCWYWWELVWTCGYLLVLLGTCSQVPLITTCTAGTLPRWQLEGQSIVLLHQYSGSLQPTAPIIWQITQLFLAIFAKGGKVSVFPGQL